MTTNERCPRCGGFMCSFEEWRLSIASDKLKCMNCGRMWQRKAGKLLEYPRETAPRLVFVAQAREEELGQGA